MDHFRYVDGSLCAEGVPLRDIAAVVGTPFYCYSTATLERHLTVFRDAFAGLPATVCFAVKANGTLAVLSTLGRLGAGADVVSGGELKRALAAGIPAERIVFSGVGKTEEEIATALKAGVWQLNVESEPELETVDAVAGSLGVEATVALRVNPDVDAATHHKITTGKSENKFGIELARAPALFTRARALANLRARGVAVHIGSQILNLAPFREAFARVRDLVGALRADGHAIERIDLGGGLGIPYSGIPTPSPAEYTATVRAAVADLGCHLILEPGRVIAGNAGILVARVIRIKRGASRTFVILDAGMNDLLRPAFYDAFHEIVPLVEPAGDPNLSEMDVVGPICESSDTFALGRRLPPLVAGDLVAFRTAGAYGASMASTYNARSLIAEVLVKGDTYAVVRERVTVDDLLAREPVPDWVGRP